MPSSRGRRGLQGRATSHISRRRTRSRSPRTRHITYYLPQIGCLRPLGSCAKTIAERSVQTLRSPLSAFPTSPVSSQPRRGARSTSQSKGRSWTRPCRRGSRRPETRHDIEISSKAHIATSRHTDRLTAFCTHPFWPCETSPLRSKYQMGWVKISAISGRSACKTFQRL
jgi:hypothetical protein